MASSNLSTISRCKKRRSGQTLVEYSLVLFMISIYITAALYGVKLPNGTRVPGVYQMCIFVFDKVNKVIYAPYGGDYKSVDD
ncbi:MAG: Flp family type IVb pilin [Candidatus Methylacidiphilales bacterium]|nr:hypothetical protein [Candidatus Methylacidiphilales bacterium]